jgi:hypothetical protein
MSIVIELDPEMEELLQKLAVSEQTDTPSLAKRLLQVALEGHHSQLSMRPRSIRERIEAMHRDVEAFGREHKLPSLPDEALTREAIYGDHD